MTEPSSSFFLDDPTPIVPDHKASADDKPRVNPFVRKGSDSRKAQPRRAPKPAPPYVEGVVRETALNMYGGVAMVLMPIKPNVTMRMLGPARTPTEKDPDPQSVIENCADAWEMAAKQFPVVRKLFATSADMVVIGALISAHAPIVTELFAGTAVAEKFNPAAAMEAYLKRRETEPEDTLP